jgi:hypothetical protein
VGYIGLTVWCWFNILQESSGAKLAHFVGWQLSPFGGDWFDGWVMLIFLDMG